MDPNQPINTPNSFPQSGGPNKYVDFFKRNRYVIFGFGLLIILISMFSSLIFLSNGSTKPAGVSPSPAPTKVIERAPTAAPTTIPTTAAADQKTITSQTKPQLDNLIQVDYSVSKVKTYGSDWAMMKVNNPNTDPANVIVKKDATGWKVILGPGTYFTESQLKAVGAPQSLIDEVNGKF